MLFLDKANSNSISFQLLLPQYHIPRASPPSLPSLSNFTLANWNPSSTQSSSCSSLVSLFFPTSFNLTPQLLDVPNDMPNRANQIYYQSIFKPIINLLKSWVSKSLFSKTTQSPKTLCSIQNALNSLQDGRCSLIFTNLLMHEITPTISSKIFFS